MLITMCLFRSASKNQLLFGLTDPDNLHHLCAGTGPARVKQSDDTWSRHWSPDGLTGLTAQKLEPQGTGKIAQPVTISWFQGLDIWRDQLSHPKAFGDLSHLLGWHCAIHSYSSTREMGTNVYPHQKGHGQGRHRRTKGTIAIQSCLHEEGVASKSVDDWKEAVELKSLPSI